MPRPVVFLAPLLAFCGAMVAQAPKLSPFAQHALDVVSKHRIVQSNPYTEWFAQGDATIDEARDLVKQ